MSKNAVAKLSDALGVIPEQQQEKVVDLLLNTITVAALTIAAMQQSAG